MWAIMCIAHIRAIDEITYIITQEKTEMSMPDREYYAYKSSIESANDLRNSDYSKAKEALREIQRQLVVKYGYDDVDVQKLIKMFMVTV